MTNFKRAFLSFPLVLAFFAGCRDSDSPGVAPPPRNPPDDGGVQHDAGQDAGPACGNGIVEGDEECDLGGAKLGCDATCRIPEGTLSEVKVDDLYPPRIATSSQGYLVAWEAADGHLRARFLDLTATPVGPEQTLDTNPKRNYISNTLRLAGSPQGFLAAWNSSEEFREWGVRFRALQPAGLLLGDQETSFVVPRPEYIGKFEPIAAAGNQGYSLVYAHSSPSRIRTLPVSLEGAPGEPSATPIATQAENRYASALAASPAPDGRTIVVWAEQDSKKIMPPPLHVVAWKDGVQVWSAAIPTNEFGHEVEPAVAVTNEGNALIVWSEGYAEYRVKGILVAPDGTFGNAFDMGKSEMNAYPSLAYSPSGEFLLVSTLGGKRFTSKGEAIDKDWFQIPTHDWRARSYAVTAGPDGSFVVAYAGRKRDVPREARYRVLPHGFALH